ncbi:MAG: 16S rRNA (uracil(1498)-N(3))-methyltransferase [Candidatus Omnitrophica bacterium]|nr:16S rRNA (uracil(1498)-N(3))-methyltransferase [Candidatus Omnitrophota bacterium]
MRFYVSPEDISPSKNIIEIKDKDEVHHIRDVMRLKKGECVRVFDGRGKEYLGDIKEIGKFSVVIGIRDTVNSRIEDSFSITLYQAIPKKSKMDFIIEKAVELGADRIVPIITERTVPSLKDKASKKKDRWQRLAKAASKQCGRSNLPSISDILGFNDALAEAKRSELVLFAALDDSAKLLSAILEAGHPKSVSVFIGPEGDFSDKEISVAKSKGFSICSLGSLVLRVETAAIYVLSSLNYEYRN